MRPLEMPLHPMIFACVALTACAGSNSQAPVPAPHAAMVPISAPPPPPRAPEAPPAQPDGRLPDLARPTRYALALDVDPTRESYTGQIRIEVTVARATRGLVLHGRGLTIRSATLSAPALAPIAATAVPRAASGGRGEPEELVLNFERDVPAGAATLEIAFENRFDRGLRGLYRVHSGNDWYAYTQFEPNDARRAFPCFDEPGFKVPWDVTLTVPHDAVAIANMPEASRSAQGDRTVVHFTTTPPTPSYLIALGVGPFDVVPGQQSPVPIRAITTRGQGALTHVALEDAAAHVRILGEYFDRPFPYPKLDLVAVPDFAAGAMENPGMITFREEAMLIDAEHAPAASRRAIASVIAHELAHHWFGDLVTMTWWNDLWLNEGFATWMQARVVDQWQPNFGGRIDSLRGRGYAMETDSLPAARAVRQPVSSTSEALEAFDGITYVKGAAVLAMLESWLGEEAFRAGIRAYIHDHEWGNATAEDLFAALGRSSGRGVAAVAATFLDQTGVPVVRADVNCPAGGAPTLTVAQSLYHVPRAHEAASASPGPSRLWQVPVCVAYEADGGPHRECVLLTQETQTAPLANATRCPRWLYPNADEAGYYRHAITPSVRAVASRAVMSAQDVRTRVGFVDDAWALVRGGQLGSDEFLRLLEAVRGEHERPVLDQIYSALSELYDGAADDASRARAGAWIGAFYRPLARELGWTPRAGESDDRKLMRRNALAALGVLADDHDTLAQAERLAQQYLHDAHSVDADLASLALPMASRHAGSERFDALVAALAHAATPTDRIAIDAALGSFLDPAILQRALDLTLTDAVRLQDVGRIVGTANSDPARRPTVSAWVHAHFDGLRARMPDEMVAHFAGIAGGACTPDAMAAEEAFWRPRAPQLEGADRVLREGLERADQCIALREREHTRLAAFLAHTRPAH